jgi:hypothetical protein
MQKSIISFVLTVVLATPVFSQKKPSQSPVIVKVPAAKSIPQPAENSFQKYVGSYNIKGEFVMKISLENGKLYSQPDKGGKMELTLKQQNRFSVSKINSEIEFVPDATGKITSFIIYTNGQKIVGDKIQ